MEKEAGITDDFRAWWDIERIWSKSQTRNPLPYVNSLNFQVTGIMTATS